MASLIPLRNPLRPICPLMRDSKPKSADAVLRRLATPVRCSLCQCDRCGRDGRPRDRHLLWPTLQPGGGPEVVGREPDSSSANLPARSLRDWPCGPATTADLRLTVNATRPRGSSSVSEHGTWAAEDRDHRGFHNLQRCPDLMAIKATRWSR